MRLLFVCAFLFISIGIIKCEPKNDRYIILLQEGSTDAQIDHVIHEVEMFESLTRQELHIESENSLVPIFFANMSANAAKMVNDMDMVYMVEKDQVMRASGKHLTNVCTNFENFEDTTRYNLDIFDQVNSTDGTYEPYNYGAGVNIYVIDTGVNYDHEDFRWRNGSTGTRAKFPGRDLIDFFYGENQEGRDCNGHGTHCAGIAAGLISGVAKDANIYSIRVLDCNGYGSVQTVYYGISFATNHHNLNKLSPGFVGSIISMSLGGGPSESINIITNRAVEYGVVVVTASGNEAADACFSSPGNSGMNINVGAHGYDELTEKKPMAYFSNYGTCVDIMAPGLNVVSASHEDNTGFVPLSGTSMSCPHVAGLSALTLADNSTLTPDGVKSKIKTDAIEDIDRSHMRLIVQMLDDAKRAFVHQ